MVQGPSQHALVLVSHAIGLNFKPMRDTAHRFVIKAGRLLSLAFWMNAGVVPHTRQHGIECETDKHGDEYGCHNGDAKLVEELANDALHKTNGQEDSHDGQGGCQNSKANFLRSDHGCVIGIFPHLHMSHDVLANHNGVVNQQAHTQGQGHERDHVDGKTEHAHEPKCTNQ